MWLVGLTLYGFFLQFEGSQAVEDQNERFSGILPWILVALIPTMQFCEDDEDKICPDSSSSETVDLLVISATSHKTRFLCVASLKNHLTWHDTPEGDQVLNLETELSVSLEVWYSSALLRSLKSAP